MMTPKDYRGVSLNELKFWHSNCVKTLRWWMKHVYRARDKKVNLDGWGYTQQTRCGTVACFGGHMAADGLLGVYHDSYTLRPLLSLKDIKPTKLMERFLEVNYVATTYFKGDAVALALFGDESLFNGTSCEENNELDTDKTLTHQQLVVNRLKRHIAVLEEAMA